ncbi:hypothetical protein AVEN_65317-1 [Araneus ventricosus]|uniref:Uncharacterized protein n=1 Tax=Araneus ventricosus TaxID=182803 RepID=A0A4Y2AGN6_ARAVE|nr:hypothetical protein AVEN_65317-1 [Araneus ventricosus]
MLRFRLAVKRATLLTSRGNWPEPNVLLPTQLADPKVRKRMEAFRRKRASSLQLLLFLIIVLLKLSSCNECYDLAHDWYKRSSPGGSIGLACDRADQTVLSRFVSGHLRSCSFSHGNKVFPVCAKCGAASASPEHILSCLRLSRETFETDPLLALDFLRVSALMDGV